MSSASQNLDFQNVLKLLEKTNTEDGFELYFKSDPVSRKFKVFTGRQNKDLIDIYAKSPHFPYHFLDYMFRLLKDLSIEKFDASQLTVYDRIMAIVQFRAHNIAPTIQIGEKTFDLFNHIEKMKKIEVSPGYEFEFGDYIVELDYPTLKTENEYERLLIDDVDKFKRGTEREHTLLLSKIFLYNVITYIRSIRMKHDGETVDFDFANKSVQQRIEIGQALPSTLLTKVMDVLTEKFNPPIVALLELDDKNSLELSADFFTK